MTDNKAIFTVYEEKYVLMHIVNDRCEDIFVYPDLAAMPIGTIINCRVEKQLENIDSSFVRYTHDLSGFINKAIKCETVMPLQYKKEPYREKKALFTDKLSIKCDPNSKDEKKAAKAIIEKVREKSQHTPVYTVLYSPMPEHIKDLIYLIDLGIEEVVTDRCEIREGLSVEYDSLSGPVNIIDRVSIRFYEDRLLSLCNLYSFNAKISEAISRKVYLKSGAYITFDQTEALCAIDVNSAQNGSKRDKDETFLMINREAAVEISRQLRLRNISGMILVDFINMDDDESYEELKECMINALSSDRIQTRFIDFTGLKLAEIVRMRSGVPLQMKLRSR